ncbi:MAG: hypothetical protein MRY63_10115 [Neomegalonema sp.]|nr:hypothetical protein [Neomegalonema sp.]
MAAFTLSGHRGAQTTLATAETLLPGGLAGAGLAYRAIGFTIGADNQILRIVEDRAPGGRSLGSSIAVSSRSRFGGLQALDQRESTDDQKCPEKIFKEHRASRRPVKLIGT